MSKKILILSGSPRKDGNSERLCKQFMAGAEAAGHTVEMVSLREKKVAYCVACYACRKLKKCVQKDDANEIIQKMIDADVLVLSSPVYFYSIAAQLKALIDRCVSRYTEIRNKEFYYIVTAAENSITAAERTIEDMRGFVDCIDGAQEKGIVYGVGAWEKGDIEGMPAMETAYEMGKNC